MASRSKKGKIVYLLMLMVMVFVVLCYLSIQQLGTSNQIRITDEGIENEHTLSLEIFKTDVDFLESELNNEEFYKTGKNIYLARHDSLIQQIQNLFKQPQDEETTKVLLNKYDSAFKEMIKKIRLRGSKDWGIEGSMRTSAHELEDRKLIPEVDLLMLRRHEKDYLLRAEKTNVDQFDALIHTLKSNYKAPQTVELLDSYSSSFHALVNISEVIGLETQGNLKGKLNGLTKQLISSIEDLDQKADYETFRSYKNGMIFLSIGVIGGAILCISLVILIASKLD